VPGDLEINLPDDLHRLLAISPSKAHTTRDIGMVRGILYGEHTSNYDAQKSGMSGTWVGQEKQVTLRPRMIGRASVRMSRGMAGRAACLAVGMASVVASSEWELMRMPPGCFAQIYSTANNSLCKLAELRDGPGASRQETGAVEQHSHTRAEMRAPR